MAAFKNPHTGYKYSPIQDLYTYRIQALSIPTSIYTHIYIYHEFTRKNSMAETDANALEGIIWSSSSVYDVCI